jgi:hypothetical protein
VSLITRILIAGLALRLASDLLELILDLQRLGGAVFDPFGTGSPMQALFDNSALVRRVAIWALHEFPQTIVYVVDIIFVEGLYRVWRNVRRVSEILHEGRAA